MAKYFCLLSTVIVTSSFSLNVHSQILSNFKIIKINTKNDAKNDWRVDEDTGRNQREFFINNGHSQDLIARKGLQTLSKINEQLSTLQDLIQYGVKYNNKHSKGPLQISLQSPKYNDIPSKANGNPFQSDKSFESIFLNNIFRKNSENPNVVQQFQTKDSSPDKIQRPRKCYLDEDGDEIDPGDGEGWFNFPITKPSCPNPAWHLSTLRRIYQKPRIFKRSPKKKNPKKKKTRDERKKFNKKKRCRRKMRIIISKKDRPKKKKGDGSYRGGRGRKPRLHRKPTNATLGQETNSSESVIVKRRRHHSSEGPVAGAYIDYDSSYVPPSQEENKNGTEKIVKNGGDNKKNDEESEEGGENDDEEVDDEEEDESDEDEEEKGDGADDDDDDDIDGSHDELMSEAYEPSFEINKDNENKNATKHTCNNGNCKHKEAISNKNIQSKIKISRSKPKPKMQIKQIKGKKLNYKTKELDTNGRRRFMEETKTDNDEVMKRKDHINNLLHDGENIKLHESSKVLYELQNQEETLLNQIMKQQLRNNLKNLNRHASILLPTIDEFIPQDRMHVKKSATFNLGSNNINHQHVKKVVELQKVEDIKNKQNLNENRKDVMKGSLSDITHLLKNTMLYEKNNDNIKLKNKLHHIEGLNKQRTDKISHHLTEMSNKQVHRL